MPDESKKLPSYAGCPWATRVYKPSIEDLHYQIHDLFTYLSPKLEERSIRESAFNRINYIISWVFPGSKINPYGSTAYGMFLPNSDLDISVYWPHRQGVPDLSFIAYIFQLTGFYHSVTVIEKAAVPLVKLVEINTGVHIDLSFNVHSFYSVLRWINDMRQECKYLDPLVLILKQFLHVNNLNFTYDGGLSSYALIVMVSHFLKNVDLDQLPPNLKESPLGALLLMFLEFYGQTFDYNECALAFYDNKPLITKKSQLNDFCPSLLTIVDPVNPENDLGRGAYNMFSIKNAFLSTLNSFRSFLRSSENTLEEDLCSPPILSLIFPVLPTDIIQRNFALRNFVIFNTYSSS